LAQLERTRIPKTSNRRRAIILLAIGVFLLLAILVSQTAFDLKFLRPGNNQEIVVFAALSALIFLLFVALTFVLARNLLKLFAERRLGVLGSKFRTRMVAGALLLSFVPIMVMYWFSYGLMNRSIDKWFSTPVEEVRADTHAMVSLLANYAWQNARSEALAIAASAPAQQSFSGQGFSAVLEEFQHHETTLQGGFVLAVQDGNAQASFNAPAPWPVLKSSLPLSEAMAGRPAQFTWEQTDYTLGSAPVDKGGTILVAIPLPREFSQTVKQVEASQERYYDLAHERRLVRRTYMGLLLLLTMIVLFVTTWLALFLSKLVTRPLAALAEATQEISRGRLDYRVDVSAADEIGDLVRSFNRMAEDLETTRRQIEASSRDLGAANAELDRRRRHARPLHGLLDHLADGFRRLLGLELPGQDEAGVVVQDGDQVVPPPADDEEVAGIGLPLLMGPGRLHPVLRARREAHHFDLSDEAMALEHPVDRGFRDGTPGVVDQPTGQLPRTPVRLAQGLRPDHCFLGRSNPIPHCARRWPPIHEPPVSRLAPPPLPAVVLELPRFGGG